MAEKNPLFAWYYLWDMVPDRMISNIMAEFHDNGAENLVFSHVWLTRILREPEFFPMLRELTNRWRLNLISPHAPYGQAYDLVCTDRARRPNLIRDHKLAMNYAADCGAKTYTIHIGAFESVFYHTPNEVLRPLGVAAIEQLLPEAEKLGLTIAVENSYERSNTPDEVLYYLSCFHSRHLGCCFDTGHANLMAPFPGKQRDRYFKEIDDAWGDELKEYSGALEKLLPHIVTCHLHDNDGYSDAHTLPGTGRIDWKTVISALRNAPRLISMQTEARTDGTSVATLCRIFNNLPR